MNLERKTNVKNQAPEDMALASPVEIFIAT